MKLLVVYQYYQSYDHAGHSLLYELTQFLADRGHDVTVISGETGYMQRNIPNSPWYRRIVRRERHGKVNVLRTYTYPELHRSYMDRLLSFISFSLSCPLGLLSIARPEVVMASSPPIFPMFFVLLFCKIRRIPFVFEVRDIWPASAVQMGILKNRQLINIMAWMERVLYDHSEKIIALTEGILEDICARGWSNGKVDLLTCSVDFNKLYPDAGAADFIRNKFGWQKKKIVLYFGALGEANNLSVILRAAQRLQLSEDILFILIGDGMKRDETEKRVKELGLQNLLLMSPVPKNEARLYINSANVCLVTLQDIPLFSGVIPSKLIDYMSCGKAVLCGVRGEAERVVKCAGAGVVFEPNNDEQLSKLIVDLLSDEALTESMGAKGLLYVQSRFSALKMHQKMETLLLTVASNAGHVKAPKK